MYSATHEFKELVKVIPNDRLKSFAKTLLDSAPNGMKDPGKPMTECRDPEMKGDLIDTLLSIEQAVHINHSMLTLIVQNEVTKRYVGGKL